MRSFRILAAAVSAALLAGCSGPSGPRPADFPTASESTAFTSTMTSAEVELFCEALAAASPRVNHFSLGWSADGRSIPLLLVADPPIASAESARVDARPVALIIGNIHAGEVCGKEASLMIARDLALADGKPDILHELIVAIVPNLNPDANDRFDVGNRPHQLGPDMKGERHNSQDLDLNRDWIKAEAPETRAALTFLNEFDPLLIIDTHTTNGTDHRLTLTYQGPKHPATDAELLAHVRDTMLPAIHRDFEAFSSYQTFFYGNFNDTHTEWRTYPADLRYGAPYRGARNRISILTEAYAYAPYQDRIVATYNYCVQALQYVAANAVELADLATAADERASTAARRGDAIALATKGVPFPDKVVIPGRDESGAPKEYAVEFVNDFVPTLTTELPLAYAYPPELEWLTEHLLLHGVHVREVNKPLTINVERATIDSFARRDREWQGHRMLFDVRTSVADERMTIPVGWRLVPGGQKLFPIAALMLEPRATDSLVAWNFFDDEIRDGWVYPVVRLAP